MAEKDIKKTPAATQTVQPSADKYTIQELENAINCPAWKQTKIIFQSCNSGC